MKRNDCILPSESFRLSLDDAIDKGRWGLFGNLWGNSKGSLLGNVVWGKRACVLVRCPFILMLRGRGGMGGGTDAADGVFSDVLLVV